MLSTIPFAGFYCSVHDEMLDYAVEGMWQNDQGDSNSGLTSHLYSTCNWRAVHNEYAKYYAEQALDLLKIKATFESMDSPREYNFTTDRIFISIEQSEVERLLKEVNKQVFMDLIKEKFTSRDGFISSYPNDLEDWPEVSEWDHNHIGTLIEAYWKENHESTSELDLMEDAQGNARFDDWIAKNTSDFERLEKIYRYLNQREARQ